MGNGFIPRDNGWGVQPVQRLPEGGDVHETFRVNESGDISGGHTTVRLPDRTEKQLPWQKK